MSHITWLDNFWTDLIFRSRINGQYANPTFNFWGPAKLFQQLLKHFAFLPAMYKDSNFPHPHQHLLFSIFVCILVSVKQYITGVLICISIPGCLSDFIIKVFWNSVIQYAYNYNCYIFDGLTLYDVFCVTTIFDLKFILSGPDQMAWLVETWSHAPKLIGSIPSQGTHQGCGYHPMGRAMYQGQLIDISLPQLSLSCSSISHFKKSMKASLRDN